MRISDWGSGVCSPDLGHDRLVDRVRVDGAAVSLRAIVAHIVKPRQRARSADDRRAHRRGGGDAQQRGAPADVGAAQHILRNSGHWSSFFGFWGEARRSEEHTSELQSLMRTSYAVFCLKNKHTSTPTK